MIAVVTVVAEDEVEPSVVMFEATDQVALDILLDDFYTVLHSDPDVHFIAATHTGGHLISDRARAQVAAHTFHEEASR